MVPIDKQTKFCMEPGSEYNLLVCSLPLMSVKSARYPEEHMRDFE